MDGWIDLSIYIKNIKISLCPGTLVHLNHGNHKKDHKTDPMLLCKLFPSTCLVAHNGRLVHDQKKNVPR